HALDAQQLLRVAGTLDQRVARRHLVAVADLEAALPLDRVGVLLAVVADDRDGPDLAVLLVDADDAGRAGQDRLVLRRAGLEQLDHPRETAGDVAAGRGHTTGVEGPHRELRAGLADRLRRDDAHGLTGLDRAAGRERRAVARGRDAALAVVGERRQHPDLGDLGVVAQGDHVLLADLGALRDDLAE